MLGIHQLPMASNFAINIAIQSVSFGIGFYLLTQWINPAPEILEIVRNFFLKNIPAFFGKK
jgi:hypothetical protein